MIANEPALDELYSPIDGVLWPATHLRRVASVI